MTLARARTALGRLLEGAVLFLMAALAIVVVVGVAFRKAGASLVWYDEVASILLAWLTYYGAVLAALHRAHIGVPTLVERLPDGARRAAIFVAEALTISFFVILAWAGARVLTVLSGTSLVSLPWVPAALAQSAIPVGAALFVTAELFSIPDALARRAGTEDDDVPPAPAATDEEGVPSGPAGADR